MPIRTRLAAAIASVFNPAYSMAWHVHAVQLPTCMHAHAVQLPTCMHHTHSKSYPLSTEAFTQLLKLHWIWHQLADWLAEWLADCGHCLPSNAHRYLCSNWWCICGQAAWNKWGAPCMHDIALRTPMHSCTQLTLLHDHSCCCCCCI